MIHTSPVNSSNWICFVPAITITLKWIKTLIVQQQFWMGSLDDQNVALFQMFMNMESWLECPFKTG